MGTIDQPVDVETARRLSGNPGLGGRERALTISQLTSPDETCGPRDEDQQQALEQRTDPIRAATA